MATYKVIQDIEAEDHILGPLSLRQFIFAIIGAICLYLCYFVISKHAPVLLAIFLPPAIIAIFFAWPWSKDQPTEVWALARIRFLFKPRKRIWDQSGMKELVTVTAPKKVENSALTNGLSENEVRSRLSALANTIDSRGWAIKNVNVNMYTQPSALQQTQSSDRLIDATSIPREVPSYDVLASDDIMDTQNNPIAQQFDQMITASSQAHRQQLVNMMSSPAASPTPAIPPLPTTNPAVPQDIDSSARLMPLVPENYWFLNEPVTPPQLPKDQTMFAAPPVITPGGSDDQSAMVLPGIATDDETALAEQLKSRNEAPDFTYAHMKTIQPLSHQKPLPATPPPQVTPQANPAILELANNNDLDVATIARQAHKNEEPPQDEVVIALH